MEISSKNSQRRSDSLISRLLRCFASPKSLVPAVSTRFSLLISRNKSHVHNGELRLAWFNDCANLGDEISSLIVENISGMKVCHAKSFERKKIISTGSIISAARNGDIVWGSGAMFPDVTFREKSFTVTAVRGPKTRKVLCSQGISCPEIYGDPGILVSDIYPVREHPSCHFKLGIIPHYVDKEIFIGWNDPSVLILDIQSGREKFFQDLWQCERVISSSLHGIIFAEAYGIPAHWMILSDRVAGGHFKFHDYYLGSNREPPKSLSFDNIYNEMDWIHPQFDKRALLQAFPLLSDLRVDD